MPRPDPDAAALLDLAGEVADRAGRLLLDGLSHHRRSVGTKTTATDMVTEMDRAAERLIVTDLRRARPDDGVLGEEGSVATGTSGVRWIVDPLDGTTNYLYGLPVFAVSIAAEVAGVVEAAVVAVPAAGETFTATRGGGARRDGDPIACSAKDDLATALVGTGFSYEADRRRRQADVLHRVLPAVRDIRRLGAAAVDLCWVACGRLDGFYERGLQPWDLAAGALVAAEAGARTGDLGGGPPSPAFSLAAAPALFEPLARLLVDAGAADA